MDFCKITEELWKLYLSPDENKSKEAFHVLDLNCIIIGTGAHEVYTELDTFYNAWIGERRERKNIEFQFKDFWCEQRELTPDIYLVYGGIYIWWENENKSVTIDMDSRFSIIYQITDGAWKIIHLHQSLPNAEQMEGEYYPRTLCAQIEQTQELVAHMKDLANKDGLTSLINYRGLQDVWDLWEHEGSWLFVIDLDDFKKINDTYGHMAGNDVLKQVSNILVNTVQTNDIVCRMGGDEFIVLCSVVDGAEGAHRIAQQILSEVKKGADSNPYWIGLSIGGTYIHKNESLESAIGRADRALYDIKKHNKNGYALI